MRALLLWLLVATPAVSTRFLMQSNADPVVGRRCEAHSEQTLREAVGGVACEVVVLVVNHLQLNNTLELDLRSTMRPQLTILGGCPARLEGTTCPAARRRYAYAAPRPIAALSLTTPGFRWRYADPPRRCVLSGGGRVRQLTATGEGRLLLKHLELVRKLPSYLQRGMGSPPDGVCVPTRRTSSYLSTRGWGRAGGWVCTTTSRLSARTRRRSGPSTSSRSFAVGE
jgi:hypothetical protein